MPQETINSRNARKNGKGALKGTPKKGNGRKACMGKEKAVAKVIAGSVFTVRLKEIPGVVAMDRLGGKSRKYASCSDDDFTKMYHDLFGCMKLGLKLVKKEETSFDPLANGFDIGYSINYVVNIFKENILPKGFDFNVDRQDELSDYYFTIYNSCRFGGYWHCFEIKPVVVHLQKLDDMKLHDRFLEIVFGLSQKADILTWWNGGMGHADYMLEEEVEEWEERNGDLEETMDQYLSAKAALEDYKSGMAHDYEALFLSCVNYRPANGILKELEVFDHQDPVVKWMMEACFFLMVPGCMNDFVYTEMEDDQHSDLGLRFMDQATIIWDVDDYYTGIQADVIDSEVNGIGQLDPIINYQLSKETKELDIPQIKHRMEWPEKLTKLYESYVDMVKTIKKP